MKFGVLILLVLFFSCKEHCENSKQASAIIEYSGMIAADGCDWVVKIDSISYHPDVLDSAFKKENLQVNICYQETSDRFSCGLLPGGIPVIHILEIKE